MNTNINYDKEQLSYVVKRVRAYTGLSQRQLADSTGICQADICKIERAVANPSLSTLSRIAAGMGANLKVDFLIEGVGLIEQEIDSTKLIKQCSSEAAILAQIAMDEELEQVILYGSCARGDYNDDSDMDIALLTNCDRLEAKKYAKKLSDIAAILMNHYHQIVNFVCLPIEEFNTKKSWYPYFQNIDSEGVLLYGRS